MEQKNFAIDPTISPAELTSWKEIAHYLGVNVRTAQKWEHTRGLPVRRAPGKRGRVSASDAALEEWRNRTERPRWSSVTYLWPLARDLTVEVKFTGRSFGTEDLELLRAYLALWKKAMAPD